MIPVDSITIRTIRSADNAAMARIIRDALTEFGANRPGTVFTDPTTDDLYALFNRAGAAYWVAEQEGQLLGGAGIYPTEALPEATCELVKMYLKPEARGLGLGTKLIRHCLSYATQAGYQQVYLESMPELQKALVVYEKLGFRYLDKPLGNSGHFGCSRWMLRLLP